MFDKSRGGDETRHKYLTHSEWHTDSKFVGLLKVGYQTSILEIKFIKVTLLFDIKWVTKSSFKKQPHTLSDTRTIYSKELLYCLL